jgi:hypothetical protein
MGAGVGVGVGAGVGSGATMLTVTSVVAAFPLVSTARAVTLCWPEAAPVVSHAQVYGAARSTLSAAPSTENSTRSTP